MTTTIADRVSLTFSALRNLKSSYLKKHSASVCFSNCGSFIVPRLATAAAASSSSSFKHLFAHGLPALTPFARRRNSRLVRASTKEGEEEDERRPTTTTWHYYQLFSVLKQLINWSFRLSFFIYFLSFATCWLILSR